MCPQTQRGRVAGGGDQAGSPEEGGVQHGRQLPQWQSVAGKSLSCHLYGVDYNFRIGRMAAIHL